ncbi:MAG TPA: OmpA family protein [Pyrinomonadaceae bacterium]|jgi:outer membrane protein OmpA-like peptidoglycan-associated protein
MEPIKPMLGDIELQLVQKIETEQDQTLTQHEVPALEGDFLQRQGRRASRLTLEGVMVGPEAGEQLETLRDKFRSAAPVSFVADIATATQVGEVLIEELSTRELAGNPERFAYALTLRERLPPPPPETVPLPEPPDTPDIPPDTGTLVIEVVAEGAIDMANVRVTLEGTNPDTTSFSRVLTNRTGDTWTETGLLPGRFTVRAATQDADPATATDSAQVTAGQTTTITLTLRRGAPVATMFLIHFRFDRAFVEPCARAVLRQVADFAAANTSQKLLIVGHTDKTGPPEYNQSLSERRARSVFAFLTFGGNPNASFAEWDALRHTRPSGTITTVKDSWGLREAQHMLQDLGDYPGNVDGLNGPLTREAVRAFRCRKGLPPGDTINENEDAVWEALIRDYMAQDSFNIPTTQFQPNCTGEILKWLGCGEEDPIDRRRDAFRPSRRTELLFVRANSLPCQVPQPDTFNLPNTPPVNNDWCVGPRQPARTGHGCFVSPHRTLKNQPQPCSTSPTGPFCRQPAEPGSITVNGRITLENGTGAANQPFVLIAPDGEFVTGELGNGEPRLNRTTDGSGNFTFADKRRGFYYLAVQSKAGQPPLLVKLEGSGDETVKGNAVCKALRANSDTLNVVIVDAPTLREIRIPAAAHLMTALHPGTREVRTCPASLGGAPLPQRTRHAAADVQSFFAAANRVWRQARIRLLLADADILREAYAFRIDCEVDGNEFAFILERCAYPNTVNFFFFGDLSGTSEAGLTVQAAITGPRLQVDGCAVSDRFLFLVDTEIDATQTEQVVAHEFGHFVGLGIPDHVQNSAANSNRLMLAGTLDGSNRTLVADEVAVARASKNAGLDCLPLTLNVTGATRIGGARSHEFVVLQNASGVVTVDAVINPRLLDPVLGSLAISGGLPGANPQQRTVSAAAAGPPVEIVATYTPVGGGNPVITFVTIHVVTFRLTVTGANQVGGAGSTTFAARRDPAAVATVIAQIDPLPFCVPTTLVTWTGGRPVDDPLRQVVPLDPAGPHPVTATVAGTTLSVVINVIVVDLDVVTTPTANAPAVTFVRMGMWDNAFDAAGAVLNTAVEANNFAGADTQKFHLRVNDPSQRQSVNVEWSTLDQNGNNLDNPANKTITLVETAAGSGVFISRGLLLVTDNDDQLQPTHSGLPAGLPDTGLIRNINQTNHRVRRASMLGRMLAIYPGSIPVRVELPVFERAPDFRRRLPLQIFVLRGITGAPVTPTGAGAQIWTRDLRIIRETYERIGISVSTEVAPGTLAADIQTFQGDRLVLVTPPAALVGVTVFSKPRRTLLAGAVTKIADTVCVFYVPNFDSTDRGVSSPDVDQGEPARGTAFINVSNTASGPYSPAHEIGHLLTDKSVFSNGGHYNEPTLPAGNRLHDDQNLMRGGTSVTEGVTETKRLWDANDQDLLNQFNQIRVRPSRFIRV